MKKYNIVLQDRVTDKITKRDVLIKQETDLISGETNLIIPPQTAIIYNQLMQMLVTANFQKITLQMAGGNTAEIEPSFRASQERDIDHADYFFATAQDGLDLSADHLAKVAANICGYEKSRAHREKEKSRMEKFYNRRIKTMSEADLKDLKVGCKILSETVDEDELWGDDFRAVDFKEKTLKKMGISEDEYSRVTLTAMNWKYYSDLYETIYYTRPALNI